SGLFVERRVPNRLFQRCPATTSELPAGKVHRHAPAILQNRSSEPLSLREVSALHSRVAFSQGIERRLGATGQLQLSQNAAHVGSYRCLADDKLLGDLLVAEPAGYE